MLRDGNLTIYDEGKYVQIKTACGVFVDFDGKQDAVVSADGKYRGLMNGLCGNCDDVGNDYTTKEGVDVSKKRDRGKLVGRSYTIDDKDDEK